MSIRKVFEEELAELKTELVEMCYLTEQMIIVKRKIKSLRKLLCDLMTTASKFTSNRNN